MKLFKSIATLVFLSLAFSSSSFGQTKQIEIVVKNIEEIKGQIIVFIYDKKENFPKEGKFYKELKFPVTEKDLSVIIKDLPIKEYAIFICHDSDGNGECNRNMIGIPTEKIGFSNNVKPKMKAPSFESTKINETQNKITINLFYY